MERQLATDNAAVVRLQECGEPAGERIGFRAVGTPVNLHRRSRGIAVALSISSPPNAYGDGIS
jgi:hypothetical protein